MRLASGVTLSDGPTRPATVKRVRDSGNATYLELTITEGRNRQVRRMIEAVDSKILKLVRIGIGRVDHRRASGRNVAGSLAEGA